MTVNISEESVITYVLLRLTVSDYSFGYCKNKHCVNRWDNNTHHNMTLEKRNISKIKLQPYGM